MVFRMDDKGLPTHHPQWSFLVLLIGGRYHIITRLAIYIYKWYISGNQKQPLTSHIPYLFDLFPQIPSHFLGPTLDKKLQASHPSGSTSACYARMHFATRSETIRSFQQFLCAFFFWKSNMPPFFSIGWFKNHPFFLILRVHQTTERFHHL